jgi:hypothetical protein
MQSVPIYHHQSCECEFRSWRGVLDTSSCDEIFATGRWFSSVSSTFKTDRHDITEILLKVTLNITTPYPILHIPYITYTHSRYTSVYNNFFSGVSNLHAKNSGNPMSITADKTHLVTIWLITNIVDQSNDIYL